MKSLPTSPFLQPLALLTALAALSAVALATPTGLNNIPTADTAPQGVFVFQAFSTLGHDRDTDLNFGCKTGVDFSRVKFEIGVSSHLYPDESGPWTPHAKIALPLGERLPTLAAGIANITFNDDDRAKAGDEFSYAVLSQNFGWLRVHGGCGWQDGEALPFFGLDKTFRYTKSVAASSDGKSATDGKSPAAAMETKTVDLFTLRGDVIAQRDSSWLYSAGVLIPVCPWFVLETWGNFPDNGDEASLTVKANFVITF
jgi:hypothetical protein